MLQSFSQLVLAYQKPYFSQKFWGTQKYCVIGVEHCTMIQPNLSIMNTINQHDILINHCLIQVPTATQNTSHQANIQQTMGTLSSNFLYYGYIPSQQAYEAMTQLAKTSPKMLHQWWQTLEKSLKKSKGVDKDIGKYIVYQNFPQEVLDMSQSEYWIRQLFIYWGADLTSVRQAPIPRAPMFEKVDFKVLHLARSFALANLYESLLLKPAVWIATEQQEVQWFVQQEYTMNAEIKFKENLVFAAITCMQYHQTLPLSTTTDVLRLATGFSEGDISLKTNSKFKLSRSQRKYVLEVLAGVKDLEEGIMRHKNKWIRLFHQLHVGEYAKKYPKIYQVAHTLRNGGKYPTFNSNVENYLATSNTKALALLAQRPGEFARRIAHVLSVFGDATLSHFLPVLHKLETIKLLKLKRFLRTANNRNYRIFTPKGSWKKAQFELNETQIKPHHIQQIVMAIDQLVRQRVSNKFGTSFFYTPDIAHIKLPVNNAEAVSRYPKGTVFYIPDNIRFIRSVTYWQERSQTCWMDNGWNFFDANWQAKGTCCWDTTWEMDKAAVFSGDPVNSYNKAGKAGQLIDLYLDQLVDMGVRYAVWNILSYNRIPFDALEDVQGLLLWGEKPQTGKLIEPSRVNFSFPVTGKSLTKYICYIDLFTRRLVLMDSSLSASVGSARNNATRLQSSMPAIVEYFDALPSLMDMFEGFAVAPATDAMKVVYTDEQLPIDNEPAFVFFPKNKDNTYDPVSLEALISV